jgi:hypothetical protein
MKEAGMKTWEKLVALLVFAGAACGGCNPFEGTKDEERPDVLNGDGVVIVNSGDSNEINVGDQTSGKE